jgi:imidazolonepropionase
VAGQRADFVAWSIEHPSELAYGFGQRPAVRIVAGGRETAA